MVRMENRDEDSSLVANDSFLWHLFIVKVKKKSCPLWMNGYIAHVFLSLALDASKWSASCPRNMTLYSKGKLLVSTE
jgi:hypothetical protein